MDVAGAHQNDIEHSVYKTQLSPEGVELKREKTTGTSTASFLASPYFDKPDIGSSYTMHM